jgi:hypothetical protein
MLAVAAGQGRIAAMAVEHTVHLRTIGDALKDFTDWREGHEWLL